MRPMIRDSQKAFDHGSDALGGPDLPNKAKGFGTLGEQGPQFRPLLRGQAGRCAWRWLSAQAFHTVGSAPFEPLADRARCDAEGDRDVFLLPALLVQVPHAQPATFAPVVWLRSVFLCHRHRISQKSSFVYNLMLKSVIPITGLLGRKWN